MFRSSTFGQIVNAKFHLQNIFKEFEIVEVTDYNNLEQLCSPDSYFECLTKSNLSILIDLETPKLE